MADPSFGAALVRHIVLQRIPLRPKSEPQAAVFVGRNLVLKVLGTRAQREAAAIKKVLELQQLQALPPTFVPIQGVTQCTSVSELEAVERARALPGESEFVQLSALGSPYTCIFMNRIETVPLSSANQRDLCSIILELFASLAVARQQHVFFWGDAIRSNVLISRTAALRTYRIGDTQWTTSNSFMPVLIDFEKSSFGVARVGRNVNDVSSLVSLAIDLATEHAGGADPLLKPVTEDDWFTGALRSMNDDVFARYDMGRIADDASNWQALLDILLGYPQLFSSFRIEAPEAVGCSACFASNPSWACGQCGCASYCGAQCQQRHWVAGHEQECKAFILQ